MGTVLICGRRARARHQSSALNQRVPWSLGGQGTARGSGNPMVQGSGGATSPNRWTGLALVAPVLGHAGSSHSICGRKEWQPGTVPQRPGCVPPCLFTWHRWRDVCMPKTSVTKQNTVTQANTPNTHQIPSLSCPGFCRLLRPFFNSWRALGDLLTTLTRLAWRPSCPGIPPCGPRHVRGSPRDAPSNNTQVLTQRCLRSTWCRASEAGLWVLVLPVTRCGTPGQSLKRSLNFLCLE